jgi:tRNA uridine 5-carbamoylmethylation protein Kti12
MDFKKVICLYGGPGSGKSTTCAGLYYELKKLGYDCEMNREYVKEWYWESRDIREGDQTYFFSKQARKERLYMLKSLDFIVTDSPLILTHFYGLKYDWLEQNYNTSKVMLEHHHAFCRKLGYSVEHFFINRTKPYTASGRYQTEEQANEYDTDILNMLIDFGICFDEVDGDSQCVESIINKLGIDALQ